MPYQYASVPRFTYQSVERKYQTFDFGTSEFKYYPVTYSSTDLTEGQNQDNKEPSAEPEKAAAPDEATPAEPNSSPDEAPAPEAAGKYLFPWTMRSIVEESIRPAHMIIY
jgi:hypothetical protein